MQICCWAIRVRALSQWPNGVRWQHIIFAPKQLGFDLTGYTILSNEGWCDCCPTGLAIALLPNLMLIHLLLRRYRLLPSYWETSRKKTLRVG